MSTLRRRLTGAVILLACAAPLGVAHAQDEENETRQPQPRKQDNVAAATTEQNNARAFDFSWSLQRQRGGVVDHRNIANAAARCTDCRASAIAFQIVLVSGSPSKVLPVNQAVAINDQCTRCVVYAGARQFVRTVGAAGAKFTGAGRSTLADVRNDLRALESQNLDVDALKAAVDKQKARVVRVLTAQVVTNEGKKTTLRRPDDNQADDS